MFRKLIILIYLPIFSLIAQEKTLSNIDEGFLDVLLNKKCVDIDGDNIPDTFVDFNNDGKIQLSEIEKVKSLTVHSSKLRSIQGIEYFKNLKYLNCDHNFLKNLIISQNLKLEELRCDSNNLVELMLLLIKA